MCMFGVYLFVCILFFCCDFSLVDTDGSFVETMETTTPQQVQAVHWSSHCKNGGIGFFGSFCHCPPEYEGRLCEIKKDPRANCGYILHGHWVKDDCQTCYCIDGAIKCSDNYAEKCPTKYGMDLDLLLRLQIEDVTRGEVTESDNTYSNNGLKITPLHLTFTLTNLLLLKII